MSQISDRIIAINQKTVIMGHVCSCCGSSVLSTVTAKAVAVKWFKTERGRIQAQKVAGSAAHKAVLEHLRGIEICKRMHTVIDAENSSDSTNVHEPVVKSAMKGYNNPCPNCRHCEPWMPKRLSKYKLEDLAEENYPTVFDDYDRARAWALQANDTAIQQTEALRASAEALVTAAAEVAEISASLEQLQKDKASIPLLQQRAALEQEKARYLNQKKKTGVLDFRGRNVVNEKIKAIVYHLDKINADIKQVQEKFDLQITQSQALLTKAQCIAYGCTGRTITIGTGEAVAFQIEPILPGTQVAEQCPAADRAAEELIVKDVTELYQAPYLCCYKIHPDNWSATVFEWLFRCSPSWLVIFANIAWVLVVLLFVGAVGDVINGADFGELFRPTARVIAMAAAELIILRKPRKNAKEFKKRFALFD